jgi:hypothetical protein
MPVKIKILIRFLLAALLIYSSITLFAIGADQSGEVNPVYHSFLDWKGGKFIIEASYEPAGPIDPKSRYKAEQKFHSDLPVVFLESIWEISVDSVHKLGDILETDEEILKYYQLLSSEGLKEAAGYTPDMKKIRVRYSYPLFGDEGLLAPLIDHVRAFPINNVLGFVSTKPFTGIVIYARGEYDVFGKPVRSAFEPALFPRMFDKEMKLVWEKRMCNPDRLKSWGMAAYSDDLDIRHFSPRIGSFPLTIMARGIFGKYYTDFIVPSDSAARLLSLEENRKLLEEGRVLIIYDNLSPEDSF